MNPTSNVSLTPTPRPACCVNGTGRFTRKPKSFWSDTAMALYLAGNP